MYLVSMQHTRMITIGILLIYPSVDSLSIGRTNNVRFTSLDYLNKDSIWLSTFTNWSECVCAVLSSNFSSTAIALNMYRNGSCQLFVTLPATYTLETNNNSTLILLQQLPPRNLAPCCSNISWLINRLNTSQKITANVTKPSFVVIDDNNLLAVVSYRGAFVQLNRSTLNIIRSTLLVSSGTATSLSYNNGFYYIPSCPTGVPSCDVNVFSTKNLSSISNISLSNTVTREITFIRNDSLMLISEFDQNKIVFYDVRSTNSYTPSTPPSVNVSSPCGLHVINDSFIYIAPWTTSAPVSTLSFSNNTWISSVLPNTTSSGQKIFQTTVDSCGRLWLSITGYGIRIFDPWGHSLLYEWPVTTNPDGFLLLNNYEFYITDFSLGQIIYLNPNIDQCTS